MLFEFSITTVFTLTLELYLSHSFPRRTHSPAPRFATKPYLNETRQALSYKYPSGKTIASFTAEELTAMVLTYARDITKDFGGQVRRAVLFLPCSFHVLGGRVRRRSPRSMQINAGALSFFFCQAVRDCVLTVPCFATAHERRALVTAAEVAGLKVLSLIEDNTAAALHYGKDNVFENTTVREREAGLCGLKHGSKRGRAEIK